MLLLDKVSLAYGQKQVLSQFCLQLEAGQRLGLVGPSGVGKSSVLQAVADLLPARQGTLENQFSRIGYVFQQPRLLPWATVLDNTALPLRAQGMSKSQAYQQAAAWLQRLKLAESVWSSYPQALSGGMAQRVSLARAFALQPDLLLLDEPFSALDPQLRTELIDCCDELLNALNCALIYVCHHPDELVALTRRCLFLQNETLHHRVDLQGCAANQLEHYFRSSGCSL